MKNYLCLTLVMFYVTMSGIGQSDVAFYIGNELFTKSSKGDIKKLGTDLKIKKDKIASVDDVFYLSSFNEKDLKNLNVEDSLVFFQGINSPHNKSKWVYLERNLINMDYNLCLFDSSNKVKKILFNQDNNPTKNKFHALKPIAWSKNRNLIYLEALVFDSAFELEGIWEYNISTGESRKLNISGYYMSTPQLSADRKYFIYTGNSENEKDQLHGMADIIYRYDLIKYKESLIHINKGKFTSILGWINKTKITDFIGINEHDYTLKFNINRSTFQSPSTLIQIPKFPFSDETPYCITRTVQPITGIQCGSFCQPSMYGHNGFAIDFGMPANTNVLAGAGGVVMFAGFGYTGGIGDGFGNCVIIHHTNNTKAYYAHLNGVAVKVGDMVGIGCLLGKSGHSGCADGAHLHWEIRDIAGNQRQEFSVTDCNNGIEKPSSTYYAMSSNMGNNCDGNSDLNLNCNNPVPITNGVPFQGTTIGGKSKVYSYGCNNWIESGPEIVHQFFHSGGNLIASLSGVHAGVDLDVYILASCNPQNCVGIVNSTSSNYNNAPAGTYYIVVEGANTANTLNTCNSSFASHHGNYGIYTLTVSSSGGGCPQPSNDGCSGLFAASPLPFGSSCSPTSTTSCGATSSGFNSCSGTQDDDVFFKFTTPVGITSATINVASSAGYNAVFQLLTAPCGSSMSQIVCVNDTGSGLTETKTISGLSPNTEYFIRVWHFGASSGTNGNFSICVYNNLTPGPFTLSLTPECIGTNSHIRLNWTASTNATSYDVFRNGIILANNLTQTQYITSSLVAGINYNYQVIAKNAAGNTNNSNGSQSATALNCSPNLPGAFTFNLTPVCNGTSSQIKLTWTVSTNATSYDIYRNNTLYVSNQTGTQYFDPLVTAGTTYTYFVQAKNGSGNTNNSNQTLLLPAPYCTVPFPDLTILNQSVSNTTVAPGSNIIASCAEYNSGNATAGANIVKLYLSTDAVLTPESNGDVYLDFINFSSLAANSNSTTNSKSIQIPFGTLPGTYYLFYWADGGQVVIESFDNNNFATVVINVSGFADLVVQNASITPTIITPGSQAIVTFKIKNQGLSNSGTSYTALRLISQNGLFNRSSSILDLNEDVLIQSLAAGQTTNLISRPITIPIGTPTGNWYTVFGADTLNQVPEGLYENNNQVLIPISLGTNCNPGTPTPISPGTSSTTHQIINSLTPSFNWTIVGGANSYKFNISEAPYGAAHIVYSSTCVTPSFTLPAGILQYGTNYRWDVQAFASCGSSCASAYSTDYYFKVSPVCTTPSTQAYNIQFSSVNTTSMSISWINGNGTRRIVKMNTFNSFTPPSNGTDPPANSQYIGSGEQVIFNGVSNSLTVSGLVAGQNYCFRIYEANCTGSSSLYFSPSASANPLCQSTPNGCTIPTSQASNLIFTNITTEQMFVNWINGNGSRRIVKINTQNNFTDPSINMDYPPNNYYNGSGEQVIYNGTGNSAGVSGLSPGTSYCFRVYEANCTNTSSVYNTNFVTSNPNCQTTSPSCTTPSAPEAYFGGSTCPGSTLYNPSGVGLNWYSPESNLESYDIEIREYPFEESNVVYTQNCISSLSTTISPSVFVAGKAYSWRMRASRDCEDCNSSWTSLRYFNLGPDIFPENQNISICDGTGVTFTTPVITPPSGTSVSYQWYKGLGSNSMPVGTNSNSYYASSSGVYSVKLSYSGSSICPGILTIGQSPNRNISISTYPNPPVLTTNSPVCESSLLTLGATAPSNSSYYWTGPNGFSSNNNSIYFQVSNSTHAGLYHCYVIRDNCQSQTSTIGVNITPTPASAYTYIASGNDVSFTNTSINSTSYSWSFGDGQTSSEANPSHTFTNNGNYTVCLTGNSSGCNPDSDCQLISIGSSNQQATSPSFAKLFNDANASHQYWYIIDVVQSDIDSGYIALGQYQNTLTSTNSVQYFKLDKNGNIVWVRELPANVSASPGHVIKSNNGYLITFAYNQFCFMKIDEQGNKLWAKASPVSLSKFFALSDGNYIGMGQSSTGYHIIKFNDVGDLVWQKQFDYSLYPSTLISIRNILQDQNSNIYLYGSCGNNQGLIDTWDGIIVKLNINGDHLWTKNYNSGPNQRDQITSLVLDENYDIIFGGFSNITSLGLAGFITKINSSGVVINSKQFSQGFIPRILNAYSGVFDCLISGPSSSTSINKFNSTFNVINQTGYDFRSVTVIKPTFDNRFVISGQYPFDAPNADYRYNIFKVGLADNSCLDLANSNFTLADLAFTLSPLVPSEVAPNIILSNFSINPLISSIQDTSLCHICDLTANIDVSGNTTFCNVHSTLYANADMSGYLWNNGETTQSIIASAQGIYQVTVTDMYGCSASSQIEITDIQIPDTLGICPGSNMQFYSGNSDAGNLYQWQENRGLGFIDITNGPNYNGSTAEYLNLISPSNLWYGNKYRCAITNNSITNYSPEYSLKYLNIWTGAVSSAWENTGNWCCGVLPNSHTDVLIPSSSNHFPEVNSNAYSRSIKLEENININITPGNVLCVGNKNSGITCNQDTIISVGTGISESAFNFSIQPIGSCNGIITQTSGIPSGGLFPLGSTTNCFELRDEQNVIVGTCCFEVIVVSNFEEIGIIGTATQGGWDEDTPMVHVSGPLWTKNISLLDGEAKFRANGNWDINWGSSAFPLGTGIQSGSNIPVYAGDYTVTFNSYTGEYYFDVISDIGIIGSATPGGWDVDTDLYIDPMDTNKYFIVLDLLAGEAKFRADDAWDIHWGNSSFPNGIATQAGPNIPISSSGKYRIDFNKLTGAYQFIDVSEFSSIGIIGSATPGGWDIQTNLTQDIIDPNIWKGEVILNSGELKFRANNLLETNWGGDNFPSGMAEVNGSNISVNSSGNYFARFNTNTLLYNFSLCPSGNISFTNQAQIDAFPLTYPTCSTISGNVTINGSNITNLNGLSQINYIGGVFNVTNNSVLSNLTGLNNLNSVGGNFYLNNNPSLVSLVGLNSLASVGGYFNIGNNLVLTNLTALNALTSIGGYLSINTNAALPNLNGLNSLSSIGAQMTISNNATLSSLIGLNTVSTIGSSLTINNNNILSNLNGLNNVSTIGGELYIYQNPSLTSLMGLNALDTINGRIKVSNNNALTNLTGLDGVIFVGGDIAVNNNAVLTSLTGLNGVNSISGGLQIYENSSLTSILALNSISSINLLIIVNNGNLTNCDAQSICNYVSIVTNSVNISGNATGCASSAEIQQECGN